MKQHVRLVVWAMAISFTGSLPLGTLNLTVANFSFADDLPGTVMFSVAAIFVEMLLVRIALMAVRQLEKLKRLVWYFNLIAGVVLLLLAFNSLIAAWQKLEFRAELPFTDLPPFVMGLLLSVINPLHVPFWIGWTAVLKSKHVLDDGHHSHNIYVLAIGGGTAIAFVIYALAGRFLINHLLQQHVLLNWVVGIVLLLTAVIQFYKAFFVQPAPVLTKASRLNE